MAQVADVVKGTLPLTKHYDAACQLSTSLNALFIDVTFEWEAITAGRLNEEEISAARRRMMMIGYDLKTKHFPGGLRRRGGLLKMAEVATALYLEATFHVETLR